LFGVVSKIAIGVADTKWKLYRINPNGEDKEVKQHPLLDLLYYFNSFQTGQEGQELTSMYVDLAGECFWVLNRNRLGVPAEIWLAPPSKMKIVPSKKEFIAGYVYGDGNEAMPLEVRDVIHIKLPNPANIYRGLGYVEALAVDLDAEDYAARWNRNFFWNSARPDGALEFEGTLTDEQFERVKTQWAERHQGTDKAHRTAILEGGGKYHQIAITQKDMDFGGLRKMNRDNILGAFGVSLSVMGISQDVNRANAEAGEYTFARWVIKPRLTRIREKLNEQLVPQFDSKLRLDFVDPVPENQELALKKAVDGVRGGFLTINEARAISGFPASPSGDVFLIPMTLLPTPAKAISSLRAKRFSEDTKATYWRNYITKTENQEKPFIAILKRLWNDQEKEVLGKLEHASGPKDALFDITESQQAFKKNLRPLIVHIFAEAARDANALIHPEPEHRSKQEDYPLSPGALEFLERRCGWLAEEINEETARMLNRTLIEGYREGESMPKLADRVRGVFDNCSKMRSLRIARTEVIMASNEGALLGYKDSEVVDKAEFYPADGACDDCVALVGEYRLEDAHGRIPVHPNCRCVWLPVV